MKAKRFPRYAILCLEDESWQINQRGVIFRHDRIVTPTKESAGLTIELPGYAGPVPRLGGKYLVDELVCYQFHGSPPGGWRWSYVTHLDGDPENCAAENLAWGAYSEEKDFAFHTHLMAHKRNRQPISKSWRNAAELNDQQPLWTGARNIPGHVPTNSTRIGAA